MNRCTLNGMQPRDSRELDRNPFDWTDAPLFEPKPRMRLRDLAAYIAAAVLALVALAIKYGVGQ